MPEETETLFAQMTEMLCRLHEDTRNLEFLELLAERMERHAGFQDDENTDIRMLEEVFDIRQQRWNIMGSLVYRVKRESLRNRLDRLCQIFPEKKQPWVCCAIALPSRLAVNCLYFL